MKRLILAAFFLPSIAFAQTAAVNPAPSLSVQDVQEQSQTALTVLTQQRDENANQAASFRIQLAQAQKQIDDLKKQLEVIKAVKAEPPKKE